MFHSSETFGKESARTPLPEQMTNRPEQAEEEVDPGIDQAQEAAVSMPSIAEARDERKAEEKIAGEEIEGAKRDIDAVLGKLPPGAMVTVTNTRTIIAIQERVAKKFSGELGAYARAPGEPQEKQPNLFFYNNGPVYVRYGSLRDVSAFPNTQTSVESINQSIDPRFIAYFGVVLGPEETQRRWSVLFESNHDVALQVPKMIDQGAFEKVVQLFSLCAEEVQSTTKMRDQGLSEAMTKIAQKESVQDDILPDEYRDLFGKIIEKDTRSVEASLVRA